MKNRLIHIIISMALILGQTPLAYAQTVKDLPEPGSMVLLSQPYTPAVIKGLKLSRDNPLKFDFIIDTGNSEFESDALKTESTKLIKYFLTALTVHEDNLWVNLSPYEKDRIIAEELGMSEMGRDLLMQDYVLKQITASLLYPENEPGKTFWKTIYQKAYEMLGTSEVPVNTFNKVWIVPSSATVYENNDTAFITESRLKVMLEEDYLALQNNTNNPELGTDQIKQDDLTRLQKAGSDIVREVILPLIEEEVNTGGNFAPLRQIYHSMILAAWFKRNLKKNILNTVYSDQDKIAGVEADDPQIKEKIYEQYIDALKIGAYDYIKEDLDPATKEPIPRKYFSGGMRGQVPKIVRETNPAMVSETTDGRLVLVASDIRPGVDPLSRLGRLLKRVSRDTANNLTPESSNEEILKEVVDDLGPEATVNIDTARKLTVITIKDTAKNQGLGALINDWVINNKFFGVDAINLPTAEDGPWKGHWLVIGFEGQLSNQQILDHEVKEIEFRRQGMSWVEAHNATVDELGYGNKIDSELGKLLLDSNTVFGAGSVFRSGERQKKRQEEKARKKQQRQQRRGQLGNIQTGVTPETQPGRAGGSLEMPDNAVTDRRLANEDVKFTTNYHSPLTGARIPHVPFVNALSASDSMVAGLFQEQLGDTAYSPNLIVKVLARIDTVEYNPETSDLTLPNIGDPTGPATRINLGFQNFSLDEVMVRFKDPNKSLIDLQVTGHILSGPKKGGFQMTVIQWVKSRNEYFVLNQTLTGAFQSNKPIPGFQGNRNIHLNFDSIQDGNVPVFKLTQYADDGQGGFVLLPNQAYVAWVPNLLRGPYSITHDPTVSAHLAILAPVLRATPEQLNEILTKNPIGRRPPALDFNPDTKPHWDTQRAVTLNTRSLRKIYKDQLGAEEWPGWRAWGYIDDLRQHFDQATGILHLPDPRNPSRTIDIATEMPGLELDAQQVVVFEDQSRDRFSLHIRGKQNGRDRFINVRYSSDLGNYYVLNNTLAANYVQPFSEPYLYNSGYYYEVHEAGTINDVFVYAIVESTGAKDRPFNFFYAASEKLNGSYFIGTSADEVSHFGGTEILPERDRGFAKTRLGRKVVTSRQQATSAINSLLENLRTNDLLMLAARYGMPLKSLLWNILGPELRGIYNRQRLGELFDRTVIDALSESQGTFISAHAPTAASISSISQNLGEMINNLKDEAQQRAFDSAVEIVTLLEREKILSEHFGPGTSLAQLRDIAQQEEQQYQDDIILRTACGRLVNEFSQAIDIRATSGKIGSMLKPFQLLDVPRVMAQRRVLLTDSRKMGRNLTTLAAFATTDSKEMLVVAPTKHDLARWFEDTVSALEGPIEIVLLSDAALPAGFLLPENVVVTDLNGKPNETERKEYLYKRDAPVDGRRRIMLASYRAMGQFNAERKSQGLDQATVDFIALDDMHQLREADNPTSQAILGDWNSETGINEHELRARYKIGLTEYPLVNRASDLLPLLQYLSKDEQGEVTDAEEKIIAQMNRTAFGQIFKPSNQEQLSILHGILLRRMLSHAQAVAFGASHTIEHAYLFAEPSSGLMMQPDGSALQLPGDYRSHQNLYRAVLEYPESVEGKPVGRLTQFALLRQAMSNPAFITDPEGLTEGADSVKLDAAFVLAKDLVEQGQSVLIVGDFRSTLKGFQAVAGEDLGDVGYIDGTVRGDDRIQAQQDFQQERSKVLILSDRLQTIPQDDLSKADSIILLDFPQTPEDLNRITNWALPSLASGAQGKHVKVYWPYYATTDSIDPRIASNVRKKQILIEMIVNGNPAQEVLAAFEQTDQALLAMVEQMRQEAEAQRQADSDQPTPAQPGTGQTPGGIDLNPELMDLRSEGQIDPVLWDFNPAELQEIPIDGFMPVILNISPLLNLPELLGENRQERKEYLSLK